MNRSFLVQFCDDIRAEVGNKTSLMGIYGGDMMVPSFPAIVPKLCAHISCVTAFENPFMALSFRIEAEGQSIVDLALPDEMVAQLQGHPESMLKGVPRFPRHKMSINLAAGP